MSMYYSHYRKQKPTRKLRDALTWTAAFAAFAALMLIALHYN